MSEKKKTPPKEPTFSNNPLKDQLSKWKTESAKKVEPPKPAPARAVHLPPPPRPTHRAPTSDEHDDAYFRSAMEDVKPIPRFKSDVVPTEIARTPKEIDEDAEAFAQLAELVATGEGFDLSDTDQFVEGIAQGMDKGLLQKLKRGDFSVQAHLDLHGLLADPAKLELERFLTESRHRGHRCVLVIHGKGLHSKDQEPVLKGRMSTWLSRGKLARIVLAFATAKPVDGGSGALYILLRR